MILSNMSTWPDEILNCLEANIDIFKDWYTVTDNYVERPYQARSYDNAVTELKQTLKLSKARLKGYHSTKLIDEEINTIKSYGMTLPNEETLTKRINYLVSNLIIDEKIAHLLKSKNQSSEENRANMIWFCFYKPYHAGEHGIGRFFKLWGGEALYNSHEENKVTGAVLESIGNPCVIEAYVPVTNLNVLSLAIELIATYSRIKGFHREFSRFETYSTSPIATENIARIIQ